jgi:hypothetical protein
MAEIGAEGQLNLVEPSQALTPPCVRKGAIEYPFALGCQVALPLSGVIRRHFRVVANAYLGRRPCLHVGQDAIASQPLVRVDLNQAGISLQHRQGARQLIRAKKRPQLEPDGIILLPTRLVEAQEVGRGSQRRHGIPELYAGGKLQ